MDKLLITSLVSSSITTSYAFASQIIVYPLLHQRWYAEHQERSFKSYILFIITELVSSIFLAIDSDDMIAPLVLLVLSYVPSVMIFRYETKFMSHVINEDYDWFRRLGILRCVLCFMRWAYLYIYLFVT